MNQLTTIIEDYQRGVSIRDLAAWYHVNPDWLRNTVVDVPPWRFSPDEIKARRKRTQRYPDELFIDLHGQGLHRAAIAREIGCGKTTVTNRLTELGLEPHRVRGVRCEKPT